MEPFLFARGGASLTPSQYYIISDAAYPTSDQFHNFLHDEKYEGVTVGEEDAKTGLSRSTLTIAGRLADDWQASSRNTPAASRSGESSARLALRMKLEDNTQWHRQYNIARNYYYR